MSQFRRPGEFLSHAHVDMGGGNGNGKKLELPAVQTPVIHLAPQRGLALLNSGINVHGFLVNPTTDTLGRPSCDELVIPADILYDKVSYAQGHGKTQAVEVFNYVFLQELIELSTANTVRDYNKAIASGEFTTDVYTSFEAWQNRVQQNKEVTNQRLDLLAGGRMLISLEERRNEGVVLNNEVRQRLPTSPQLFTLRQILHELEIARQTKIEEVDTMTLPSLDPKLHAQLSEVAGLLWEITDVHPVVNGNI